MLDKVNISAPSVDEVNDVSKCINNFIVRTPVMRCAALEDKLDIRANVYGKLEFLQHTGTFKPRGALANLLALETEERNAGITAVSAGNHAIGTAYAAKALGINAKVVMLSTASPVRIEACESLGAEIVFADSVNEAFSLVNEIQNSEGRFFVHPFEGRNTVTGTATIGLELSEQIKEIDAVIVAIGGGGLAAGIGSFLKQINPNCEIIGVEPEGAPSISLSIAAKKPIDESPTDTIADSLAAPFALPYSFYQCQQFIDEIVTVTDNDLRVAMNFLFSEMKIAVEPACAATTAALMTSLKGRFKQNEKIAVIFCGSNIDGPRFLELARLV